MMDLVAMALLSASSALLAWGVVNVGRGGPSAGSAEVQANRAEVVAHHLGLRASGKALAGEIDGFRVHGVVRTSGALRLVIETGLPDVWSADAHGDRLATGDRAFDAAVAFVSPRTALRADTRAALLLAVEAGVVHEGGAATVRAQGLLPELGMAVRTAVRACRRLHDDHATDVELAATDPDPGVRLLALKRARGPQVTRRWLRERTEDPHLVVGCEAALRLGDEGVGWLLGQLGQPERTVAALHALARADAVPPDPRLIAALADTLPRHREPLWADLAGRVGTVALVPVLRRVGTVDALHAIRRIQARATGDQGDLSLAEAAGGALSEAGGDGRVSEPEGGQSP